MVEHDAFANTHRSKSCIFTMFLWWFVVIWGGLPCRQTTNHYQNAIKIWDDVYSCTNEKNAVLVLCDVQCFITWCLDRYGHFNDVILNWHQVYSIGGATPIHNLNYCPRSIAFLCKKAAYKKLHMGCLKKTRNQCQPRGWNFDHDGCAQMYSKYIVKVLLDNRPKTDFKYFSSLNNYRLAKICKPCGYVRDTPQHMHH